MLNKIVENFPNLEKEMDIQVQEAFRIPNRHDQKNTFQHHVIGYTSVQNKQRTLKAVRSAKSHIKTSD
jgi:hypothetical protein